jgi:hypothetical protein
MSELPVYRVSHQVWCPDLAPPCDCGAAEAQAEIDALADTVSVQRQALDRVEAMAHSWVAEDFDKATSGLAILRLLSSIQ